MVFAIKNFLFIMGLFAIGYAPCYHFATAELRRYIGAPFVLCYALILLAGFFAPNQGMFFAATAVIWAATVRDRFDAVCRYVLLVALVPPVAWSLTIGGTYISIFDSTMGLSVILWLVCLVRPAPRGERTRPRERGFTAEDQVIALLFLILLFATRPTAPTLILRGLVSQGVLLVLPYYLLRRHVRDPQQFRILIACFAIAAVILSVIAIFEVRRSWSVFLAISGRLGDSSSLGRLVARRGNLMRASTTMGNALMMASFMVTGLIAIACSRGFIRGRAPYFAAFALGFLGLLAPQSRGNTICFALALLLLFWAWRRYGLAVASVVGAGVGGTGLFILAKISSTVAAFLKMDQPRGAGQDYDYRQQLFRRGMQEAMKHPIFGQSLNQAMDNMGDLMQGEHIIDLVNTYLTLFIISGVVGMVPLIGLMLLVLRNLFGKVSRAQKALIDLRAFVLASWGVMLAELSFVSMIDRFPYMVAFILAGGHVLARERRRRSPHVPVADAVTIDPARPVRVFAPPILPRPVPQTL